MNVITTAVNYFIPLLGVMMLIFGFIRRNLTCMIIALWLSLVALVLQYRVSDGEILGTYFDYTNASLYTLNFSILLVALIYLLIKAPSLHNRHLRYTSSLFVLILAAAGLVLMINVWINAYFIETKRLGTPMLQVITFSPPSYCSYEHVFYRLGNNGKVAYLCPNHYGLIPSVQQMDTIPDVLKHQLSRHGHIPTNTNR